MASSQIVNIEDKKAQLDSNTIQGQLDVSSKLTQNTKSVFALSSVLRADKQKDRNLTLAMLSYNFVRAGQESFIDNGFIHLRYGRIFSEKTQWETFSQLQYNEKLKIKFRGLLGTGPRFNLYEESKTKLALGVLYMYEYNEIGDEGIIRQNHRLSAYFTVRYKPTEKFAFSSTSYYQPILNNFSSNRVSTVNTLSLKINYFLSFTTSFSLTYDPLLTEIVPDIPSTTFQWKNGLRILF